MLRSGLAAYGMAQVLSAWVQMSQGPADAPRPLLSANALPCLMDFKGMRKEPEWRRAVTARKRNRGRNSDH